MVSSGVPQGSVLGPVLFLIFINDLDSALVSMILKFADDTKVLRKANSDKDREIIQHDLHRVLNWSYMWHMPCNTIKCVVMHLGARNAQHTYVMESRPLEVVTEEKDLGVTVCNNLKSARQRQLAYANPVQHLVSSQEPSPLKVPVYILLKPIKF